MTEINEIEKIKQKIFHIECADRPRQEEKAELYRLQIKLKELEELEKIKELKPQLTQSAQQNKTMFTPEKLELLRRTQFEGATEDEFKKFVIDCDTSGLSPFSRQIYSLERWDEKKRRTVRSTQVSIDGFRLIAERTGQYAGQKAPQWCGKDGVWRDVWTSDEHPYAARVGVMRRSFKEPLYAIAKWNAYVSKDKSGNPTYMWKKMDDHMLAKTAEALALRKAFPQELSGFYTLEEMSELFNEIELYEAKPEQKKELSKIFSSLEIEKTQENYLWFSEKIMGCKIQNMSDEIQKLIPSFSEFKKEKTNG